MGKYLKYFKNEEEFLAFKNSDAFSERCISYIRTNGALYFGSSKQGGVPNELLLQNKENNKKIYDYLKSLHCDGDKLEYISNTKNRDVFRMDFGYYSMFDLYPDGTLDNTGETSINLSLRQDNKTIIYYSSNEKINSLIVGEAFFNNIMIVTHEYDDTEKIGYIVFDGMVSKEEFLQMFPDVIILNFS